jgi:flagellar hook-length control protein FliK
MAVPLSGLAIEIAGRARAGKNDFAIRLDPPELGRIEVKLSVDRQGQITSHVIADRPDTLDLMRRDASGLERSLQDAGLKMSGNGLQFSLRDQSSNGQQNTGSAVRAPQIIVQDSLTVDTPRGYTAYGSRIGGLDIRV